MPSVPPSTEKMVLVIPVFNDWDSLGALLDEIDLTLDREGLSLQVLAVDDASTLPMPPEYLHNKKYRAISAVEVLELRRNLGHQRAIVIALAYIDRNIPANAVIVMDADGEDLPSDIPRLIERYRQEGHSKLVFAKRQERSEGAAFKFFYVLYRGFFFLLTGTPIRFGNFSIMPRKTLERLVAVTEIWNHYSSGVLKSRVPYVEIATKRGRRTIGKSRMNFVSLVAHGLSSLSVYGDTIGVRSLIAITVLSLVCVAGLFAVFTIRVATDLAIPGWASYLTGFLLILLMNIVMMLLFFVFMILHSRTSMSFLPIRDHHHFVLNLTRIL